MLIDSIKSDMLTEKYYQLGGFFVDFASFSSLCSLLLPTGRVAKWVAVGL